MTNASALLRRAVSTPVHYLLTIVIVTLSAASASAQSYDSLKTLKGHATRVYFSAGAERKAGKLATQLDRVTDFYSKHLRFKPDVTLLILSPADWDTYSRSVVYGMPHYTNEKTLIVAAENNDFWRSFIPDINTMPKEMAAQVTGAYADSNGSLSMEPFFDLLAIHELGHAYHKQAGLVMQRSWMSELFVNVFLHSYVAGNEPGLLPALTTFPNMVVESTDKSSLKYSTLNELEEHYDETAQQYPRNYGWYQCRWHKAAANIYDRGGLAVFKKLWDLLQKQKEKLNDQALAGQLIKEVHQSVADVLLRWDEFE